MKGERHQFRRFAVAGAVCVGVSSTWLIVAWWELHSCSLLRQVRHQVTYSILHLTAFPFAIGWLAAHVTWAFCFPPDSFKVWRVSGLVSLYLMVACVWYFDMTSGHLLTYQLENACEFADGGLRADDNIGDAWRARERDAIAAAEARVVAARDRKLAEDEVQERVVAIETLRSAYHADDNPYLKYRERDGLLGTIKKGNAIVPVAMLLTLAFQIAAATTVWCVFVHWLNTRGMSADANRVQSQIRWLMTVILAFSPWLVARAYANYYEEQMDLVPTSNAAVVFALIVVTMLIALLYLDLWLRRWKGGDVAKSVGFACMATFAIVLVKVPAAAGLVHDALSALHVSMVIGLCLLSIAALACIGWCHLDR
jgi:hypothetical protein